MPLCDGLEGGLALTKLWKVVVSAAEDENMVLSKLDAVVLEMANESVR